MKTAVVVLLALALALILFRKSEGCACGMVA